MNLEKSDRKTPNFSLGWELEAIHRAKNRVSGVECGHDGSVGGQALEYKISKECVFDPHKSLAALRALATDPEIQVDRSCGFHVHIGLGKRTRHLKTWAKWFVQLARDVESEAFAAVPVGRRENRYCRSWKGYPESLEVQTFRASKHDNGLRYSWVNPVEIFRPGGIRTIEIRLMGNTKRYSQLLAWTSACRIMAASSWALMFDPSSLEMEREKTRSIFKEIQKCFIDSTSKKLAVACAVNLADRAGLIIPRGNPLELLLQVENRFRKRVTHDDYRFNDLRDSYRINQSETRPRVFGFAVGDTVECITEPDDGGLTVGNFYRVMSTSGSPQQPISVLLNALSWCVNPLNIRRVNHEELVPA